MKAARMGGSVTKADTFATNVSQFDQYETTKKHLQEDASHLPTSAEIK